MTEQEAVKMVTGDLSPHTDFSDPYWVGVDPIVLQKCFDKGFITWAHNKLVVTPLGRRSCGGVNRERHN
jgi:hypothetical protein